jgi:hypothetical protein
VPKTIKALRRRRSMLRGWLENNGVAISVILAILLLSLIAVVFE